MFGSAEAGRAAMTLVRGGGAEFNTLLESMNNSLGSTDSAFQTVSNTQNQQFREAVNASKNAAMDFGNELMGQGLLQLFKNLHLELKRHLRGLEI